ncbi:hypothetical protein KJ762_08495 [bacterium]|nr:hypothetical protein [bacterium]MBU1634532.1 hypothetical protein [bacterium]MBU1872865.1 hypothetical protein [bacterium]
MTYINSTHDSIDLGGFTVGQWKEKRRKLISDLNYNSEWEEVVDWYIKRLKIRYFDPMRRIEKNNIGEGFSLVTVHCVLIEHFASITQGKIFNHNKNKKSPKYEYSLCSKHFQEFLKSSSLFSEYFNTSTITKPEFDTKDFYSNVRCALLHEACTKNNWRINTLSCGYYNPNSKLLIKEDDGIKRLYRDVLTVKLSEFLVNYNEDLKKDEKLRLYFARKMDHLCEIEPDKQRYIWWRKI